MPSLFGSGISAAEDEDVKTTLLTEGSLAAAVSRFTVLLTALETTALVSVLNDTSEACNGMLALHCGHCEGVLALRTERTT